MKNTWPGSGGFDPVSNLAGGEVRHLRRQPLRAPESHFPGRLYAKIIATAPKEDRCLTLMQKGRYRTLCTVSTAMRKLGDVRRKLFS